MPAGSPRVMASVFTGRLYLPQLLLLLEEVLDAVLLDQQVRGALAIDLQAVAVVPLDAAADFLAIRHDDDHRRPGVHLLDVVEALGVRRLGWCGALLASSAVAVPRSEEHTSE